MERDWGGYRAARTNKGWIRRENRAVEPWELFILSELSLGEFWGGEGREGMGLWVGEHLKSLSRAELFQELIPHQTSAIPQGQSLGFTHGWKFGKRSQPGGQILMSLHTCKCSLWVMINYYQLSFAFAKRCALVECREDFGDDSSGGGFASGITTSSQAGCEGWWHPEPYWGQFSQELLFGGKKTYFDEEVLLFQGEEGKKPPGSAKSLAAHWCGE